ncbi:MAG: hypothetical protein LQ342_001314 [Letrouitia transgressa]|nr:MAG: hypothetical protein LQ342_001314 [Letrouitia transgressa]
MSAPSPSGLDRSASKRARSTDSSRSGASTPVPKAPKTEEGDQAPDNASVPAFLRQSATEINAKFGEIEYQQLLRIAHGRRDPESQWAQQASQTVRLRNRYINIQPWDKCRVHLKVPEGQSDYINASPISLRDPRTGTETIYIAAQGPKEAHSSHFWHMVWQHTNDVAVIVMLTQTAEGGREKCFQYFPLDHESEVVTIDPLDASETSFPGKLEVQQVCDEHPKTTIRKMLLTFGNEAKTVWHMLFSGWPDFEVPRNDDRAALLDLLRLSTALNSDTRNPRIVHCSAGVGRSGSFIALEYLLAQLDSGAVAEATDEEDMVFDVVNRLREQRMTMVQSELQYHFLYEVLKEQFQRPRYAADASSIRHLPSSVQAVLEWGTTGTNGHIGDDSDSGENRGKGKAPNNV